ncbi:hypothetical protein FQR65_LT16255 [Abscondita terminalis]|nr:hypothetical protein FQR65_LT16255 [Abscondita terminalis]
MPSVPVGVLGAGAKRTVRMEDGILQTLIGLPTEAEWEYAALGLVGNTGRRKHQYKYVNEWVGDYTRQLSFEIFEDFNPFRGNVFTDKKYDDAEQSTLAKDKYGRPVKVPAKAPRKQTWAELQSAKNSGDSSTKYCLYLSITTMPVGFDDEIDPKLYGQTTLVNN